jgi:hypothetical protein
MIKKLILTVLLSASLFAQGQAPTLPSLPLPPPPLPFPRPVAPIICDGTETPCNPEMPWVRGHIEKFCGTATMLAKLQKEYPGKDVKACACRHRCDPADKYAPMTDNRQWDGRCEARCNPKNCRCPSPCDT